MSSDVLLLRTSSDESNICAVLLPDIDDTNNTNTQG